MAKYADLEPIVKQLTSVCVTDDGIGLGKQMGINYAMEVIAKAPTVDAVEVVHGHWRYYSTTMQECSNCQRHTARHKFKYCPHCGAIMEDKYHESTD